MPQTTRDPIVAIASLITALQTIVSRTMDPFDCVVVTVGEVHGGTANNIIPMSATIHGTIRTMTDENRELARQRLDEISRGIAAAHGVDAKVTLNPGYPVVNNAPEAVERFLRVARAEIGPDRVCDDAVPTMGGEDFAYYGAVCPTCFYQLGLVPQGETWYPSVHTPIFDFNDDAIATGVKLMVALALSADTPA